MENDSIQSQTYKESSETTNKRNSRKRQRSATPESVQNINETTLNDKSKISDSTTQNTSGNAKVLVPFWNEYTQEESKKWWLPERSACVTLDLNSVQKFIPIIAKSENS